MPCGVIIINKEEGLTSQAVVNRVKRIFGEGKAGHTGTLDPMATGVLPVLLGRGVKASEFMLTSDKHYIATLRLGLTTDTEDVTGVTLTETEDIPDEPAVLRAIASFVGEYMQIPPMYSALKVGGKKLCDLAREGKQIERTPRPITVYRLDGERINDTTYRLLVDCSKGTYIRTLCADIGEALGVGGVMSALCRREASGFSLAEAHTLEEIEQMSEDERSALILPVERIFEKHPIVTLAPFFEHLGRSGCELYQTKLGTSVPLGTLVRLYGADGFFARGEVREYEGATAIKPIRQF